jgi:hypothetical protein
MLPLSFGSEPEPLSSCHELAPLSSFPFFLMATFKLINGYGHKSFKPKAVFEPKRDDHPVEWNQSRLLRQPRFVVDDVESARSGPPWTSFSVVFYSMLYMLVNFVINP